MVVKKLKCDIIFYGTTWKILDYFKPDGGEHAPYAYNDYKYLEFI